MLKKEEILSLLKEYKKKYSEDYGIKEIGIFGSYATDETSNKSDVDVFVKLKNSNIFLLSRIKIDLEELLNVSVDVIQIRKKMNNYLKKEIEKKAISA